MPRSGPTVLFQLGETPDELLPHFGDYVSWYQAAFGAPLTVVDGRSGEPAPHPRDYAGVIVSGSSASLTRPEPWMEDAAAFVVRAHDVGTPVLGVCFGHQLIAHAFGGRVVRNPHGWEIGSHEIVTTDEGARDPLFAGLARTLRVNLTHEDIVEPGSLAGKPFRVLATNTATAVQALAVGEHTRGVQFHPEISGAALTGYIRLRRPLLLGLDPDLLLSSTTDSPDGLAVLSHFRERCLRS